MAALGEPQLRFDSIHVVGTNGKSSVAALIAALLDAHGRGAGAYVSPHAERWTERVLVGGREISPGALAAALERVAAAASRVDAELGAGEAVTQFEAFTAAAFCALADAGVEVAAVEAGLGGRLDATNVLRSAATVLTSVELDHTEYLGETRPEIAAEKLAVLRPGSTLVIGELDPEAAKLARRTATDRGATVIGADDTPALPGAAPFARRNLGLACAAARLLVGDLDPALIVEVARRTPIRGRAELVAGEPPMILDAAHNPAGAAALSEALPVLAGERAVVGCLAVLEGKDAGGIVAALAPRLAAAVATRVPAAALARSARPGTQSVPPERLAAHCREAGVASAEAVRDPRRAAARALALAADRSGVALCAGTHYLLPYARAAFEAARRS